MDSISQIAATPPPAYLVPLIVCNLIIIALIVWYQIHFVRNKTRNLEERNRRLAAIRRLDQVMITTYTNLDEVAEKVTDALAFELGFQVGVLALVNEQGNALRRVAMSRTPAGIRAMELLPFNYQKLEIPIDYNENIAVAAVNENKIKSTHDLYSLFAPTLDRALSKKIQETVGVRTSLVYPIHAKGKVIGVMIVSLDRNSEKLSVYEKESIGSLIDVVGVALDNAMLYKKLGETTTQLQEANDRLKQLDKLKDDFVSVASHELRTPMTAIKSYLWMALNKQKAALPADLKRYMDRAYEATDRLINLVNEPDGLGEGNAS